VLRIELIIDIGVASSHAISTGSADLAAAAAAAAKAMADGQMADCRLQQSK
jgi:hypothetical protein